MQENTKENTYSKFGTGLTSAANMTLKLVGAAIFLALTWYAMRYTQYIVPVFYEETPVNTVDSMWKNLLAAAVCVMGVALLLKLEKRLSEKIKHRLNVTAIIALSLWIALAGLWWLTLTDRQPVGDQAFIYGGASYFMEGQYGFLDKGGYFDIYPHQLGLTFLVELLIRVAGYENYRACQLVCVAMAVGIGIMGWLLIGRLTRYKMLSVCYCLLMFCCLPLIFYTGWVYGDVPSIFFMLLTAVSLLYYEDTGRRRWLALLVFSVVMAVLVRKNSLIMVIALLLSAGVYAIVKKDKKLFAALALAAVLPWLAYMGIYKMYEVRSGYEYRGAGIPAVSYLAMGMQEDDGKYGWYTLYGRTLYSQYECDSRLAAEVSQKDIRERLDYFVQHPSYAWQFYSGTSRCTSPCSSAHSMRRINSRRLILLKQSCMDSIFQRYWTSATECSSSCILGFCVIISLPLRKRAIFCSTCLRQRSSAGSFSASFGKQRPDIFFPITS